MTPAAPTITTPPTALSRIVADFEAAGVRPTALAIISKATDDGLTDREITDLVDELATQHGLGEVAA